VTCLLLALKKYQDHVDELLTLTAEYAPLSLSRSLRSVIKE
jgi:hypothetical protein